MKPIPRFLLIYFFVLVAVACGQLAFNSLAPAHFQHSLAWVVYGAIGGTTLLLHLYLLRRAAGDAKAFIRGFMAVNTIKIFLYLGFLVVFVLLNRATAAPFIGHFAAYYFIFTAAETILLYRYLLPKKKS